MSTIRCKFKVETITRVRTSRDTGKTDERGVRIYAPAEARTVVLQPVYSSDPNHENKKFWDATPSGKLEFTSVNCEAVDQMELGGEFYIDITPAPASS